MPSYTVRRAPATPEFIGNWDGPVWSAAETAQVDVGDDVLGDAQRRRDPLGGRKLHQVALAVPEGQGVGVEALVLGDGEHGAGVQAAAQQDDCVFHGSRSGIGSGKDNR